MVAHLRKICAKEGVAVEPEALALIARAAEGSVRDALSLLDQAIAHGSGGRGGVAADHSRHARPRRPGRASSICSSASMKGDIAAALAHLKAHTTPAPTPREILIELAEFCISSRG